MCDSPTHEDTLNYHILRYNRQIVRQPNRRKIKEKLRSQIEGFEVNTLNKVPFLFKKRAPTGYCRLPMLQQLEDLQLKLHRWRYSVNPHITMRCIKQDLSRMIAEETEAERMREIQSKHLFDN